MDEDPAVTPTDEPDGPVGPGGDLVASFLCRVTLRTAPGPLPAHPDALAPTLAELEGTIADAIASSYPAVVATVRGERVDR